MEYLLPDTFFHDLSTWMLLLLLAVAILCVARGADLVVGAAVALSIRLRIPKGVIGATVVSIGTTVPEAVVSVMAAIRGMPDFALGNSVGSIICDTGLIFGLCCLISRLPADKWMLGRQGWVQFGSGVLLALVCVLCFRFTPDSAIPRRIGFGFLLCLIGYMWLSLRWSRGQGTALSEDIPDAPGSGLLSGGLLALGLMLVIPGSHVLIQTVRVLCERWGVPPSVLAATLIAFGTSLPELVTAITCVIRNEKELLVGNIVGADILNVLFVTGAAAAAVPLAVHPLFLTLHLPVMIAILVTFRIGIACSGGNFPRILGLPLLAIYGWYLLQVLLNQR